jgi:hypothetical protein
MPARLVRAVSLALWVAASACERSEPPQVATPTIVSPAAAAVEDRTSLLPATFPRDIPIPEGLVAKSVQSEHAGSYVALFSGELEPDAVHRFFSERLADEGWTIDKSKGVGPEFGIFAEKDERIATVIATRIDGKLHVELGVFGGD